MRPTTTSSLERQLADELRDQFIPKQQKAAMNQGSALIVAD